MRSFWKVLVVGFCGLIFLTACQKANPKAKPPKQAPSGFAVNQQFATQKDQQKQALVSQFVQNRLTGQGGIYTNYLDTATRQPNNATGHEYLSESAGLWLLYLAGQQKNKAFRQFYQQTRQTFWNHGQFSYRYDPRSKRRFPVNATLDDLRIIRALLLYDQVNHVTTYRQVAADQFAALQKTSLQNGRLVDFYDVKTQQAANTSSLAYFDFLTLKYFERPVVYASQLKVVQRGYLGDVLPLYAASYDWSDKHYSTANLNTAEALETLLHLAEVHQLKSTSLNWLRQQVAKQNLHNGYSTTGTVTDQGQSAAVYAIAALIFARCGERTAYQQALNVAWKFQVTQAGSPLEGGIGIAATKTAYSFDNLTVINAAAQ